MAQTIGDGPNRGRSAPAPRPTPLPQAKRSSSSAPRSSRPAPRAGWERPRPQEQPRQQQQFFQLPAERKQTFDVAPQSTVRLVKEQKPLTVEVVPQRPQVVAVAPETTSPWVFAPKAGAWDALENRAQANDQIVQTVADQYNVKARLGARDAKRGEREAADRQETSKPFTAQEWAALSPMQQAAAQANADLSAAIQRDFATQSKHVSDDAKFNRYQARVNELFGEDRAGTGFKGLEYAPNTLAFLDSRGLTSEALAGRTLDDLISGDALIDVDTVKDLHEKQPEWDKVDTPFGKATSKGPGDPRGQNILFAQQLAKGQLAYQEKIAEKLERGDRLLSDITAREQNTLAGETYGAKALAPPKTIEVRPELAGQIDKYMQALARPDIPMDQALKTIDIDLADAGATMTERAQIWENMIERSRVATTGEGKWFDGIDMELRSPLEVAEALGAPSLKRESQTGARLGEAR